MSRPSNGTRFLYRFVSFQALLLEVAMSPFLRYFELIRVTWSLTWSLSRRMIPNWKQENREIIIHRFLFLFYQHWRSDPRSCQRWTVRLLTRLFRTAHASCSDRFPCDLFQLSESQGIRTSQLLAEWWMSGTHSRAGWQAVPHCCLLKPWLQMSGVAYKVFET